MAPLSVPIPVDPQNPIPGVARVAQIDGILCEEPLFKGRLGEKDFPISRREGKVFHFHRLAYEVAVELMQSGIEPLQAEENLIRETAQLLLRDDAVSAPAAVPSDEKTSASAALAEPDAAEKPAAPGTEPALKPKVRHTAAQKEEAAAQTPAVPIPPPDNAGKRSRKKAIAQESVGAPTSPEPQVNVPLAIFSLLASAEILAERDQSNGAEKRRQRLQEISRAYCDAVPV